MNKIFTAIALGSNLGNRAENLSQACDICESFIADQRKSQIYCTEPMYLPDQPDFLNMALCGYYEGEALPLLRKLKTIEADFGRKKTTRFGPRIIDLDIIFFGDNVIYEDELIVPHPRLEERDFVLSPLLDICPDFVHPKLQMSVKELHAKIASKAEIYESKKHG